MPTRGGANWKTRARRRRKAFDAKVSNENARYDSAQAAPQATGSAPAPWEDDGEDPSLPKGSRTESQQITRLGLGTETVTRHSLECWCCGRKVSDVDVSSRQFVNDRFKAGWRWMDSEKYGTIGPMCPKCVRTPDKDRGE